MDRHDNQTANVPARQQQELQRQLQEAHDQLLQSEKLASLGQLAAGVAHEINNPVGYVNSNLCTLQDYLKMIFQVLDSYESVEPALQMCPEALQKITAIKQQVKLDYLKEDTLDLIKESREGVTRVKQIVENLKDFSRLDDAQWQLADLHQGLDSTLNIVNNEIKYKAEVIREYGDIPMVECMASQLNQVFMNLLVNAAQAIEEHGVITVRTGMQGDMVWVEIADTGKGIEQDVLDKVFDPFFTTKPVGKGTGLGLSLSSGIIDKHGGCIDVSSEPGKGSVFRVTLPVSQQQDDGPGAARSGAG